MQRTQSPDICLYSGAPGPHDKTRAYSLPFRSSARKQISDLAPTDMTPFTPEKLASFDDMVKGHPLGKQLAGQPQLWSIHIFLHELTTCQRPCCSALVGTLSLPTVVLPTHSRGYPTFALLA